MVGATKTTGKTSIHKIILAQTRKNNLKFLQQHFDQKGSFYFFIFLWGGVLKRLSQLYNFFAIIIIR